MLAKIQDTYFMKLGSCMDIDKQELGVIAGQIEQVINTNFPHIRVHIGHINDLVDHDADEMMVHTLCGIPHPENDSEPIVLETSKE